MEPKARVLQEQFISNIKAAMSPNVSFVDELAELLHISTDSAYRRIRCETLFNIEEISSICKHFRIAFDPEIQHLSNKVTFDYLKLDDKKENFALWLHAMSYDVKRIGFTNNNKILYAADDVPIWHHFYHPTLAAFKIFYWLKCILCEPNYVEELFDPAKIDNSLIDISRELLDNYDHINSTEIWTEDTVNSTLKQIEYFYESGYFKSKADAILICDLFEEEINILQRKAAKSSKSDNVKDNFNFYKSEIMIGNNSILVNIGTTKIAYVSNNTFNMMSTTNADFVNENEHWLENLIKKSVLISGVSEKQRNQFFKVLRDKIEVCRNRIENS